MNPPSTVWQVRRAEAHDAHTIAELEQSLFATDAWSLEMVHSEIASRHSYYLVAFDPERPETVVAYAGVYAPQGAPEAEIHNIAVVPAARRNGLARVLMNALIAFARRAGAREIFLEVRVDNNAAIALYEQLGFASIGIRAKYYQPDGVDANVMKLRIPEPQTRLVMGHTTALSEEPTV